jgi:hypothetical protein
MDDAYIRPSNVVDFTANGERNVVTPTYTGAILVKVQKVQCRGAKVVNEALLWVSGDETVLHGSGGESELGEVSGRNAGNVGIGETNLKRQVENGSIDVAE